MLVEQKYEFKKPFPSGRGGEFAGITLELRKGPRVFVDEWSFPYKSWVALIEEVSMESLSSLGITGVKVVLKDLRCTDVDTSEEAIRIAVRGCLFAAREHLPGQYKK